MEGPLRGKRGAEDDHGQSRFYARQPPRTHDAFSMVLQEWTLVFNQTNISDLGWGQ